MTGAANRAHSLARSWNLITGARPAAAVVAADEIRGALTGLLRRREFTIVAGETFDALRRSNAAEDVLDVVIVDAAPVPSATGDLRKQIEQLGPRVPAILLTTALDFVIVPPLAASIGALHLAKPINLDAFDHALVRALGQRAATRDA